MVVANPDLFFGGCRRGDKSGRYQIVFAWSAQTADQITADLKRGPGPPCAARRDLEPRDVIEVPSLDSNSKEDILDNADILQYGHRGKPGRSIYQPTPVQPRAATT